MGDLGVGLPLALTVSHGHREGDGKRLRMAVAAARGEKLVAMLVHKAGVVVAGDEIGLY